MKAFVAIGFVFLALHVQPAIGETTVGKFLVPPAGLAPEVYFVNLKDGDTFPPPFRILFGFTRIGIAPAEVALPSTCHHHLLINTALPPDLNKPIAFSDKYRHYGAGQAEAIIELLPGIHTLQLVFADSQHRPFLKIKTGESVVVSSRKITIDVMK